MVWRSASWNPTGESGTTKTFAPPVSFTVPTAKANTPTIPGSSKAPSLRTFSATSFCSGSGTKPTTGAGMIKTESAGELTLYIDRALDLDCAYGQTGRDALRGTGPSQMPEARDALRSGKLPRRAGFILDALGQQFSFNLNSEAMALGTAKLPEVEDAESPRVVFEERVTLLRDLGKSLDALFETFLKARASSAWEGQVNGIRKWIMEAMKKVAAA